MLPGCLEQTSRGVKGVKGLRPACFCFSKKRDEGVTIASGKIIFRHLTAAVVQRRQYPSSRRCSEDTA